MYRLQTQWVNCSTQASYIASLATWSDAAKDYYFNTASTRGTRTESLESAADHPFQLGDAPWVIRCHSFRFEEQRRYHSCTDYRTDLAISTAVTRVGRSSMDMEHNVYHELPGEKNPKLLCQIASSIIVFSPDTGKPVAHGMEVHAPKCCPASLDVDKWLGEEPPSNAFQYTCKPRFSDLDGHGHVNNAVLLSYLQDARHAAACGLSGSYAKLEDVESMYVEFLSMAGLEDTLTIFAWQVPNPQSAGSRIFLRMVSARGSRAIVRARLDLAEGSGPKSSSRLQPSATAGVLPMNKAGPCGLELALQLVVEKRREIGLLRHLTISSGIDFCSNDYLGFARSKDLARHIEAEVARVKNVSSSQVIIGSTGSRLLSGNSTYCEALETELADFHGAEAALIFQFGLWFEPGSFCITSSAWRCGVLWWADPSISSWGLEVKPWQFPAIPPQWCSSLAWCHHQVPSCSTKSSDESTKYHHCRRICVFHGWSFSTPPWVLWGGHLVWWVFDCWWGSWHWSLWPWRSWTGVWVGPGVPGLLPSPYLWKSFRSSWCCSRGPHGPSETTWWTMLGHWYIPLLCPCTPWLLFEELMLLCAKRPPRGSKFCVSSSRLSKADWQDCQSKWS